MGNIQEPDNMTRVTASVTGETEKKRLGWCWAGRGQGETLGLHPPPPEVPLVLRSLHWLWLPKIPSLVLPLILVAPSFAPLTFLFLDRFSSRMMFSKVVKVALIEMALEKIPEGGSEPCRYLVDFSVRQNSQCKGPEAEWASPAYLRDCVTEVG